MWLTRSVILLVSTLIRASMPRQSHSTNEHCISGSRLLDHDTPQVADPLHGLANLYSEQGKYAEAEPLYQRVLQIWEQTLGPQHPNAAYPLNNLAILYK